MPLRVVKRKGSENLYIRGSVRGTPVFESAGTTDREQAELLCAKRQTELYEASVFGARAVVSFQRAVLAFLEYEDRPPRTKQYLTRLLDHFGATALAKIDQDAADQAVKKIVGTQAAAATKIRGVYTPLIAVLNFAARRKWCDHPKFEKPTPPSGKVAWLAPLQAVQLIATAAPHLQPLLVFLLGTGARLCEAIDLQWADVDLPAARAVLRDTKNGSDRVASLPPAAVIALANLPHREGAVFRRDDGKPYVDRERLQGGQIKTAFATACRHAGLVRYVARGPGRVDGPCTLVRAKPTVTPHDLRHTWATWFYGLKKDLLLLADEGGWRNTRMVERYAHLMRSELLVDIALVWGASHPRNGALPRAESVQSTAGAAKTA